MLQPQPQHRHQPGPALSAEEDGTASRHSSPSRPASPAHEQEQGQELEQEQLLPEEAVPASVTSKKNKVVLDLHALLSTPFPSHFHLDVVDLPYYEGQPPAASLLVLDPALSRSWLRPTPGASDAHGYWNPSGEC